MKTFTARPSTLNRQWFVVDCTSAPVGRLATVVAKYLMGKHKPSYTAHIDSGDHIIVINAAKLKLTGNKFEQKTYYRHSGYPGAIKQTTAADLMKRDPAKIIEHAVKGMLPPNKLRDGRMARLKIYNDEAHEHEAQKPTALEIK